MDTNQNQITMTAQEYAQMVESQTAHKMAYAAVQVKKAQKEILQTLWSETTDKEAVARTAKKYGVEL